MLLDAVPETSATLSAIPDGREGTIDTMRLMAHLVAQWKVNPIIRSQAISIVRAAGIAPKNFFGEARAVFEWTRANIRYTLDVRDVETVSTPDQILKERAGDCDDMALLICCLLESIGHPTRFRAIAFSRDQFEHVFAQTKIGAKWVSLDATEPYSMGWQPGGFVEYVDFHN